VGGPAEEDEDDCEPAVRKPISALPWSDVV